MLDLRWLAGFFDGEGCIGIYAGGRGGHTLMVQVGQNDSPVSRKLFDDLISDFDCRVHSQTTLSGRRKFNAQMTGERAEAFLTAVMPHLVIKKEQAKLALDWFQSRLPIRRDERGRIVGRSDEENKQDRAVALLLRQMKKGPIVSEVKAR